MADGVGERLLGDAEQGQLHLGGRPRHVIADEVDPVARQALDPFDQPLHRHAGTQVIQHRQPQLTGHVAQLGGDRARQRGRLRVAARVQATDQQRQVLQRPIVEVGGEAHALGLGQGHGQVALHGRAAGQLLQRPDRQARHGGHEHGPDDERGHRQDGILEVQHQSGHGRRQADGRQRDALDELVPADGPAHARHPAGQEAGQERGQHRDAGHQLCLDRRARGRNDQRRHCGRRRSPVNDAAGDGHADGSDLGTDHDGNGVAGEGGGDRHAPPLSVRGERGQGLGQRRHGERPQEADRRDAPRGVEGGHDRQRERRDRRGHERPAEPGRHEGTTGPGQPPAPDRHDGRREPHEEYRVAGSAVERPRR